MTLQFDGTLALVGAGKMGGALLAGWLRDGLAPGQVLVQDPGPPPDMEALLAKHAIAVQKKFPPLDTPPRVLLMAVKPQVMDNVFAAVAPVAGPQTIVISVAAGKPIAGFEARLKPGTPVVRAIPNTPAAVGRGMTVACANAAVSQAQRDICTALLGAVGDVAWIEDEDQMDAVTAVSGSGPAYVFYLTECLARAGVDAGLDPGLAMRIARQTVLGSGELLRQAPEDAATLRANVTSPQGTTAAALDVLMRDDALATLMSKAIAAATKRGRELAG